MTVVEEGGANISPKPFRKLLLPCLQKIFEPRQVPRIALLFGNSDTVVEFTLACDPEGVILDEGCSIEKTISIGMFLYILPRIFQANQSEGIDAVYHFSFTGAENVESTVTIKNKSIAVEEGLMGSPNLHVTADSRTWIGFLAKEVNLLKALVTRKIRIKGSPRLMKDFAKCFPA